jgi:hypothetical protein
MTIILLIGFQSLLFIQQFLAQNLEILHLHHRMDVKLPTKLFLLLARYRSPFYFRLMNIHAKFQYLCKAGWTQAMTKFFLCTCCMSSDVVSDKFFSMANNVKQNNAPKTIVTPPVLWLQHKELGINFGHFSDAPMHMLFLGVTKHLIVHVDCLFGNKNSNYQTFCRIISEHIKFGKDISLDWCPISDFAEANSISTTGWQSARNIAFLHVFGLFWVGGRFQ